MDAVVGGDNMVADDEEDRLEDLAALPASDVRVHTLDGDSIGDHLVEGRLYRPIHAL